MKKTMAFGWLALSTLILTSCDSNLTSSVAVKNETNHFKVTGIGKTELVAKNNAIAADNKACGSRSTTIVVDEQTAYNGALKGVVDEQTGQIIQAAATVLGNIAGTNTGLNQKDDYQTTLTFRCQAK